jgi:hypothetical protein
MFLFPNAKRGLEGTADEKQGWGGRRESNPATLTLAIRIAQILADLGGLP